MERWFDAFSSLSLSITVTDADPCLDARRCGATGCGWTLARLFSSSLFLSLACQMCLQDRTVVHRPIGPPAHRPIGPSPPPAHRIALPAGTPGVFCLRERSSSSSPSKIIRTPDPYCMFMRSRREFVRSETEFRETRRALNFKVLVF